MRAGLEKLGQKELPFKYFYDAVGSALFEVISLLPEYGLTRAGECILRRDVETEEITSRVSSPVVVAELGSSKKTRLICSPPDTPGRFPSHNSAGKNVFATKKWQD